MNDGEPTNVIHVSESFAGGVSAAIRDYVRNTPQYSHHLVYSPRDDAPMNDGDLDGFVASHVLPRGHVARVRALRVLLAQHKGSIIHAHSSYAGVYVRLAARATRSTPIVYTPHCYAYERRDVAAPVRLAFRAVELALAVNTSAYAACSEHEASTSGWRGTRSPMTVFVPNVAPGGLPPVQSVSSRSDRLTIVAGGRLGPQKDPDYYIAVVSALSDAGIDVRAKWIGGGDETTENRLRAGGIEPTGWLARSDALAELSSADLYVHVARWEGFPIAILEAEALGIPTVARRIAAFDGVDMPFFLDDPADLARRWSEVAAVDGRVRLVDELSEALSHYTNTDQARVLGDLYGRLSSSMKGSPLR